MKMSGKNTKSKDLRLDTEIYPILEDTLLMNKALKKFNKEFGLKGKDVLEIGCGNCFNALFCAKLGAKVTATDINEHALIYCKEQAQKEKVKVKLKKQNMFDGETKKYDLIFFNPPYLISENIEDLRIDGGQKGRLWIDKFLKNFYKHLKEDGKALLIHADYNDLKETERKLASINFSFKIYAQQHLFFEDLYVLLIERKKI